MGVAITIIIIITIIVVITITNSGSKFVLVAKMPVSAGSFCDTEHTRVFCIHISTLQFEGLCLRKKYFRIKLQNPEAFASTRPTPFILPFAHWNVSMNSDYDCNFYMARACLYEHTGCSSSSSCLMFFNFYYIYHSYDYFSWSLSIICTIWE